MADQKTKSLITTCPFTVTSADTDLMGRIRLGALANLLIQSAILSADRLGFGYRGLQRRQLFWVLIRLSLQIDRPLWWYDQVEVETWPKDIKGILYLRDFILRDRDQRVVVRGTSGWLPLERGSKRPRRLAGPDAEVFARLRDRHAISNPPVRLSPVKGGRYRTIPVRYYDIDLNQHVTSTRYLDWMMNEFPADFHRQYYPRTLSVNYLKETLPGETLRVISRHQKDLEYVFQGNNLDREIPAFRGRICFADGREDPPPCPQSSGVK